MSQFRQLFSTPGCDVKKNAYPQHAPPHRSICEPRCPEGCTTGGQQAVLSLKSRVFQCHDGGSALSVSANILYIQTVEPHLTKAWKKHCWNLATFSLWCRKCVYVLGANLLLSLFYSCWNYSYEKNVKQKNPLITYWILIQSIKIISLLTKLKWFPCLLYYAKRESQTWTQWVIFSI